MSMLYGNSRDITMRKCWSMYNVQRFQRYENYLLGGLPVLCINCRVYTDVKQLPASWDSTLHRVTSGYETL